MSRFDSINLEDVPLPEVVETLEYEEILTELLEKFRSLLPEWSPQNPPDSDPVMKILQTFAYRETIVRARINDAGRSVMLAFAQKSDLDNLGTFYGVSRQTLVPASPNSLPPVKAVMEEDSSYRQRIQLAPEAFSTAGPRGMYTFHAKSASSDVEDVYVSSPSPGEVLVQVLPKKAAMDRSHEVIAAVSKVLNKDEVRPLTDKVTVEMPTRRAYRIEATVELVDTAFDEGTVIKAAQKALEDYSKKQRRLGSLVSRDSIYATLRVAGVRRVVSLLAPRRDMDLDNNQYADCTSIVVTKVPRSG